MPRGFGFWLWWLTAPYWYPYLYWLWRCWWFPWLPRWWWTGIYGPITPLSSLPAYAGLPKEQEIALLEEHKRLIEETLSQINRRLKELREGSSTETSG